MNAALYSHPATIKPADYSKPVLVLINIASMDGVLDFM